MFASTVSRVIIGVLLIAGVLLAYTELVTAVSVRDLLGLDKPEETTAAADSPKKGQQTADNGVAIQPTLKFDEIIKVVEVASPEQRKAVLADKETFQQFVENEARQKSVLAAASANKIDQDEQNLFLAKRGAENVLREIYINRLIAEKIPDDFPNDEQIRKYYEQNKDRFVLGQRVYVWQIFLPYTRDMDDADKSELKKEAGAILADIKAGEIDFATAAQQHSSHQGSKFRGGYMGLVKVSDLKPAVKDKILDLKQSVTSEPLEVDDGVHLVKRGDIVEEQRYTLDQVRGEIRKLLDSELRKQLRQAIYEQASESYPVDLSDKKVEEWRLKLRTNVNVDKEAS